MTLRRTASILVVIFLLAGACSGDGGGAATASTESAQRPAEGGTEEELLTWGACASEIATMAGLDCADLEVPVDHDDPDGASIDIAVARVAAEGPDDDRIGSLVLNPGGPGGSGIEFLANAATAFPAELRERFDLVSFDPRGVAESAPVWCLDDATLDEQLRGDLSPEEPSEVDELIEDQAELVEGCEQRSAELLTHMSTADVAEDLDDLREALGDEQLTYLGLSYGTSIGAVYATLFPGNSRALVLDGAVSPEAGPEERARAQALGFEDTFETFAETCDEDPECPLAPDTRGTVDATRAALAGEPLRVPTPSGTRPLTDDLFVLGIAAALYDTATWGTLASAIADLEGSGGATLLSFVDRLTGRQPDGTYDNSSAAQTMVNCADSTARPDREEGAEAAGRIAEAAPTFGPALGWGVLGCLGWPLAENPVPPISTEGAPPVLVVGTLGDPATPYEWSEQMVDALDEAVLLTYEGDGHTAFLGGGPCIQTAVVDYLVDLVVPDPGTSCPATGSSDGFGSIRDEVLEQFIAAGLPEEVAQCVIDGIIDEVGEAEFERLVLSQDPTELTRLVTAQGIRCATGG